ncbi:protein phosphatase 2C 29-like [Bidens hawaiensis]|uniref:protein phosphatase 2C 29-like n=1 Tax=Bidens hawaiensis TaxID=980011 RepID=UPI0040495898
MGAGFSQLLPCLNPPDKHRRRNHSPDLIFTAAEPLDETLGHSFCYVRSSNRFLSPNNSSRFLSPSQSLRFSPPHDSAASRPNETGFKAISGASVSANTLTPRTVIQLHNNNNIIYDEPSDCAGGGVKPCAVNVNGFESTSSFSALPLQPLPRGDSARAAVGQMERGFFMSGPIERGALSGPLDSNMGLDSNSSSNVNGVPFSAPLNGGVYVKKRRKKSIHGIRKAFNRNFPRPWVVPVRNFVGGRKESPAAGGGVVEGSEMRNDRDDVQWALGKAGEDRVHVVVSEEHGWLFVGIYDGFNGPDAPEFLMGNLYKAMYKELEGLFWDLDDVDQAQDPGQSCLPQLEKEEESEATNVNLVTRQKRLWEYLAEEGPRDGLDLSGSERFAFSVDDAVSINKTSSEANANHRSLLLSKLGFSKRKEGSKLFGWKLGLESKEQKETETETKTEETDNVVTVRNGRKKKSGPVDHELVLRAMSRALEVTEFAYLDMTDKVMDQYPELALMGSCLLAVLMRDEDVYVMNLGDSRAIVAQHHGIETEEVVASQTGDIEDVVKESIEAVGNENEDKRLTALQLSTDHSTSIEEEVTRIKNEHPDDDHCIVNDRVKGRLKVTRAFGVGSLKQAKWNDSLLEMFRNEFIGNAPYISCVPSLKHHQLCQKDQFLVLSSDGLYQYFSNQEVVSHVDSFMEKFPDGDPAQHLIEELLLRAAKKAGMDLHELLDIPQGDRRKYHDDVTVMVVSLEGRIWKSSGKYL